VLLAAVAGILLQVPQVEAVATEAVARSVVSWLVLVPHLRLQVLGVRS
jgi:hypothetical protein